MLALLPDTRLVNQKRKKRKMEIENENNSKESTFIHFQLKHTQFGFCIGVIDMSSE